MEPVQRPLANDTLYGRIDEMQMSAADRELAKARLQAAERFVDGVYYLLMAIRSRAAYFARHVRTASAALQQR